MGDSMTKENRLLAKALTPKALSQLLAALELSKVTVVDVLRGRSVTEAEVELLRTTIREVDKTIAALNVRKPWKSSWSTVAVHGVDV